MGPDRGDPAVLQAFNGVPAFDQLLLRAALRSVLIWHELGRLGRPLRGAHAAFGRAVPIVVQWMERRARLTWAGAEGCCGGGRLRRRYFRQ